MKRTEGKTQTRQDNVEGERRHTREAAGPSLDPLNAAETDALELGETAFQPQADRHAALLSPPCSDAQRTGIMLRLQRTYGNAYVQRLLSSMAVQAKLTVNSPDDIYEQEADRVAEKVVGSLNSQVQRQEEEEELQMEFTSEIQRQEEEEELQMKPVSEVQRQEEEEEELQMKLASEVQRQEEEEELMMKPDEGSAAQLSEAVEARINAACSNGQQLSADIREPMEQTFGADFNGVRIHTDSEADGLSKQLNAKAFTTGQDIFFREGEYSPDSESGQRLIAHELTHVVQQAEVPYIQRQGKTTDDEDSHAFASSSLHPRVRNIGLSAIRFGKKMRRPDAIETGREILRTGKLRVRALSTNLMAKPAFVGVSLQGLKRGTPVTVLHTEGSWYRVRTDDGTEGWVHANRVTPQFIMLRSGETGSGSTRGEQEHAGRG